MIMRMHEFWTRARSKYHRTGALWLYRRELALRYGRPLISFTFDDFPQSALQVGGPILQKFGGAGTYYASLGLMDREEPSGKMFSLEDLRAVAPAGHELGCHTFGHFHSWETPAGVFEASILENRKALERLLPGSRFSTFSYPICAPRVSTKRRMSRHFTACRGGGQTFNAGVADLNYLAAFFLEKSRDNAALVKRVIDANRQARGWLIFATHGVELGPTPYGCTPEFFEEIVAYAAASAEILTVQQALGKLATGED